MDVEPHHRTQMATSTARQCAPVAQHVHVQQYPPTPADRGARVRGVRVRAGAAGSKAARRQAVRCAWLPKKKKKKNSEGVGRARMKEWGWRGSGNAAEHRA